jgi:hypothetical protein
MCRFPLFIGRVGMILIMFFLKELGIFRRDLIWDLMLGS